MDDHICQAVVRATQKPCRYRAKHMGPDGERVCGKHVASTRGDCAICLSGIHSAAGHRVLDKCGHGFHTRCVRTWLAKGVLTCPVCRAPCVSELRRMRGHLEHKVQMLVRTLPPPAGAFFPTYVIGLMSSPPVQAALDLDDDCIQLMIDIAYETLTQPLFFRALRTHVRMH